MEAAPTVSICACLSSMPGTLPQAFRLLGGSSVTHLGPGDLAANVGEELADTARLLSHVVDCIVVRRLRMSPR
jgi:ornithine carbamoyltransferase